MLVGREFLRYSWPVAFRDDREAAHARADALRRELAERDEQLSQAERELAEARRELDTSRAKSTAVSDARADLESFVSAAEMRAKAKQDAARRVDQAKLDDVEKQRVKRLLRSIGGVLPPVLVVGTAAAMVLIIATLATFAYSPLLSVSLGVATVTVGGGSVVVQHYHVRRRLAAEFEWAATRPFLLTNYPDLLECKPRRTSIHDREGHKSLTLELEFTGAQPPALDSIVAAFDSTLQRDGAGIYGRESPVTTLEDTLDISDTNVEVYRWVRRCERELLAPLHRAHGLRRVHFGLA